jgi:hypothetical protein
MMTGRNDDREPSLEEIQMRNERLARHAELFLPNMKIDKETGLPVKPDAPEQKKMADVQRRQRERNQHAEIRLGVTIDRKTGLPEDKAPKPLPLADLRQLLSDVRSHGDLNLVKKVSEFVSRFYKVEHTNEGGTRYQIDTEALAAQGWSSEKARELDEVFRDSGFKPEGIDRKYTMIDDGYGHGREVRGTLAEVSRTENAYQSNADAQVKAQARETMMGLLMGLAGVGAGIQQFRGVVGSLENNPLPPAAPEVRAPPVINHNDPDQYKVARAGEARTQLGGGEYGKPLEPEEMYQIVLTQRAFAFSDPGRPATDPRAHSADGNVRDTLPKGAGRGVGPADGGRAAGHAVFAFGEITDSSGRVVARARGSHGDYVPKGQYEPKGAPHAEERLLNGFKEQLRPDAKLPGGEVKVVLDQLPCGPEAHQCMKLITDFAEQNGLKPRIFVPERDAVSGSGLVMPRTTAKGAQRADYPPARLHELTSEEIAKLNRGETLDRYDKPAKRETAAPTEANRDRIQRHVEAGLQKKEGGDKKMEDPRPKP